MFQRFRRLKSKTFEIKISDADAVNPLRLAPTSSIAIWMGETLSGRQSVFPAESAGWKGSYKNRG
jgi:hypothetical protein